MSTRTKREGLPRRQLLSDSARLMAASTAASMLAATASASASSSQPAVRRVNPPTLAAPRGYSHVVEVSGGKTVYISGQISVDKTGAVVGPGNLRAQAQQVFENLKAALEAVGGSFADVVKMNFYVLDAAQIQVIRDVRDTFIKADAAPASTLVEIRRLVREELLLEVDAIAHIGA